MERISITSSTANSYDCHSSSSNHGEVEDDNVVDTANGDADDPASSDSVADSRGGDDADNSLTSTTTATDTSALTTSIATSPIAETNNDDHGDDNNDRDVAPQVQESVVADGDGGDTTNKVDTGNETIEDQPHPPPPPPDCDNNDTTTATEANHTIINTSTTIITTPTSTSNDTSSIHSPSNNSNNNNDNSNSSSNRNRNHSPARRASISSSLQDSKTSLIDSATTSTSMSESQRISELRAILPDATDEQLMSILRENDRASQITRQSADDAKFAAATAALVREEEDAGGIEGAERLSRTSDSSGGEGCIGISGGIRGSISSIDSRSRRSWRPCQPPTTSRPGVYHSDPSGTSTTSTTTAGGANNDTTTTTATIHGIEYDLGSTDLVELEVKKIEIASQLQEELATKIGYNLCDSGVYDAMEKMYEEGEKIVSSTTLTASQSSTLVSNTTGEAGAGAAGGAAAQAGMSAASTGGDNAAAVGAGGTTTNTTTTDGSVEQRRKKKVLPTMMMWDAPPLSRRSIMQREPDIPDARDTLPLPSYLQNGRDGTTADGGTKSTLGEGGKGMGRGRERVENNDADGEICLGTTARLEENTNDERKREETGDHHVGDDLTATGTTSLPPRSYDVAIRCHKCRVTLKVNFDMGLVLCPTCRSINTTTDYDNNG